VKTCHLSLQNSLSLHYTTARWRFKIYVDLEGILAWD